MIIRWEGSHDLLESTLSVFPHILPFCENGPDSLSALLILEVAEVVDYLRLGHLFSKLHSQQTMCLQTRKKKTKVMPRKLLSTFCDTITRFSGRLWVSYVNVM